MASYYYLASQLPFLVWGEAPPMSSAAFRELARPMLSEKDLPFFDMVEIGAASNASGFSPGEELVPSGCDFIDRWREWERALRLALARQRAQKLKRENAVPFDAPLFPADAVQAAVKALAETPLDAERLLDRARWDAAEFFAGTEYFHRNTIYAYLLKLVLLEREAAFKAEEGFAEYKKLYASILESAETGGAPAGDVK